MSRHRKECTHPAWVVTNRKWCYSDERLKAALEEREPEWLDTLKCRDCPKVDVRKHNPDLPPPAPQS
ncbi:MAG TPA: hypothetical protein VJM46_01095 [Candidatus Saccharimonadales bacterium]|nr:hypothetical protein [Candidatus Saccharimonadales bacterium]